MEFYEGLKFHLIFYYYNYYRVIRLHKLFFAAKIMAVKGSYR
jgi:hypothetical protein